MFLDKILGQERNFTLMFNYKMPKTYTIGFCSYCVSRIKLKEIEIFYYYCEKRKRPTWCIWFKTDIKQKICKPFCHCEFCKVRSKWI